MGGGGGRGFLDNTKFTFSSNEEKVIFLDSILEDVVITLRLILGKG